MFELSFGDIRISFCLRSDYKTNCYFSCLLRASWNSKVDTSTFLLIDFDLWRILGLNIVYYWDVSTKECSVYVLSRKAFVLTVLALLTCMGLETLLRFSFSSSQFIYFLNFLILSSLLLVLFSFPLPTSLTELIVSYWRDILDSFISCWILCSCFIFLVICME